MNARLAFLRFLIMASFRNLWRSPRRTMISLFAIAAAAAALITFQSFVDGVRTTFRRNVITSQYGHYQIFKKGVREFKTDEGSAFYQITNAPEVRKSIEEAVGPLAFLSRRQQFFGLVSTGEKSTGGMGIGIDAEEEQRFLTLTEVKDGKPLANSPADSIFLGYIFAKKLGVKVGDFVTLVVTTAQGSINALDLQVVGTYQSGITELDNNMYFIHYETAVNLLQAKGAHQILLGFKSDDELQYKNQLDTLFKDKFPDLDLVHWQVMAPYFANTMGWLDSIFKVVRVIIILIATLSIINVFTITLLERTGEFGTMRAIGTRRREVTGMILVEGMMQAVFGSVLGVVVGIGIITLGMRNGISMPPPLMMSVPFEVSFAVPWRGVATTSVLCIVIAGGAGILPALKMSKINIVEALGRNV
jgi:putative ABC transport system permease protein